MLPKTPHDIIAGIAQRAVADGRRIGVAESLTGGAIAAALSGGDRASEWFSGGIVAYRSDVKHRLLRVAAGPVVTADAAQQMATRTAVLLDAHLVVAVTGEAGPTPQEDVLPGTVWCGIYDEGASSAIVLDLSGEPADIVAQTVRAALTALSESLGCSTARL